MHKPTIVMVGGFLGAGKTTLLLAAARELKKHDLRSALIMNDQGGSLVDSELAAMNGFTHGEVTGGCFCCKFSNLASVLNDLRAFSPDVIFAEPVGSCTDISATTLQPLRTLAEYDLAPFTVLIDPARASQLVQAEADQHMHYLFTKQLEEADIVCFTKADVHSTYPDLPAYLNTRQVRQLSAATGQGVAAWLDEVLSGKIRAGSQILDIDYEQYAQAEAALVWLNLRVELQAAFPSTPAALLGPFFDQVDAELTAEGVSIMHMKGMMRCATGYVKAATCRNGQAPAVEGDLEASPALEHDLLLNLRGLGNATRVRLIVEKCLDQLQANWSNEQISCFHPAAPKPQHRFSQAQASQSEALFS